MKALELIGQIDEGQHLNVMLSEYVPPGPVRIIVLMPEPEEDEAGVLWMQGVAHEWQAELMDEREDIYSLADGEPIDEER